ncbi:MAG: hypothetical protein AAFV07_17560, partial [Bacteroidota bacterium]
GMNETLVLYIDTDRILAAIEPFEGKFTLLGKGEPAQYALYFHVGSGGIQYGQGFSDDFQNEAPGIYGKIFEDVDQTVPVHGYAQPVLELLTPVLEDLENDFRQAWQQYTGETAPRRPLTKVLFSNSLVGEVRTRILSFLQQRGLRVESVTQPTGTYLLRYRMDKGLLPRTPAWYGMVEALQDTLHVSLFQVEGPLAIKSVAHQAYPGYGQDPRLMVIARYVVEEVNKMRHVLDGEESVGDEIKRQMAAARQWQQRLLRSRRGSVDVRTALAAMPNSPAHVTLTRDTIDALTKSRSLQIGRYFEGLIEPHIRWEKLDRILLIGDRLNHEQVLDGFMKYGAERRMLINDHGVYDFLKGMHIPESSIPKSAPPPEPLRQTPGDPLNLQPDARLVFTWAPNRRVVARYLGNRKFMIIQHENSSVITGDTFRLETPIMIGQKALLRQVTRTTTGKILGDYKSGVITSLQRG